jgi:hypothetical protein
MDTPDILKRLMGPCARFTSDLTRGKRLAIPLLLAASALAAVCAAQYPAPNEIGQRVSPVYPKNRPYVFSSTGPNYDPFQFNWYSGRWDYVPIPHDGAAGTAPYRFNSYSGRWEYAPPMRGQQPNQPGREVIAAPPAQGLNATNPEAQTNAPSQQNDEGLWVVPATQPTTAPAPRTVSFQGKLVSIRATDLNGDVRPHLLLRLRSEGGANATVDVGNRLDFVAEMKLAADVTITVKGKLGSLDNYPVLFADQLIIGAKTFDVDRRSPAR